MIQEVAIKPRAENAGVRVLGMADIVLGTEDFRWKVCKIRIVEGQERVFVGFPGVVTFAGRDRVVDSYVQPLNRRTREIVERTIITAWAATNPVLTPSQEAKLAYSVARFAE